MVKDSDIEVSDFDAAQIGSMKKGLRIDPETLLVELAGFEPATLCLQSRCATSCAIAPKSQNPRLAKRPGKAWAREDLNLRPHPYQGCALTS
jgi:hypothetical protein